MVSKQTAPSAEERILEARKTLALCSVLAHAMSESKADALGGQIPSCAWNRILDLCSDAFNDLRFEDLRDDLRGVTRAAVQR